MKKFNKDEFRIEDYLARGVENIIGDVVRATLTNPKESAFMARFALAMKAASKKRVEFEKKGEHIPAFLIASITSSCNLHCAGCYARANNSCCDSAPIKQLTAQEWNDIFIEARDLGIGFSILIGGEPLIRRDIIEMAGKISDMMFPIFTNATLIDDRYVQTFSKHRNLVPVISIEGQQEHTDLRRGAGVYERTMKAMINLKKKGVPFGASVTVTKDNLDEIISENFIESIREKGCKVVFFVEFVPTSEEAKALTLTEDNQKKLMDDILILRKKYQDMVFLAFPGDEKSSGGCLAAGRGFFHINSHGGAEPCPFSPYSDISVKERGVREALKSGLFSKLQSGDILMDDHEGGCVLYEKRRQVEALLAK